VLVSLSPAEAAVGSETVVRGQGFTPTGNTLRFGTVDITDLESSDGGTMIRFTIPRRLPSRGEVPPMVVWPGEYEVVVRNSRGTSNVLRLVVKE
jgi:hypothetical protein